MNGKFALYVNGFVGSSEINHQLILSTDNVVTAGAAASSENWMQSKTHIANKDIIEMYVQMSQSPLKYVDFEWREKVLKEVMRGFGTKSLDQWLAANYIAGHLTETRKEFLDDTIRFVLGGNRCHPAHMYISYIGMATDTAGEITTFSKEVEDLLCCSEPRFALEKNRVNVVEFVQSWISRPNGFRDLLTTAMVLWGDDTVK